MSDQLKRCSGELKVQEDLLAILADPQRYPPERHRFLIDMMRKFELCFDFPDDPGRHLLVPARLSPDEPAIVWDLPDAVRFEYQCAVLPPGIIPRFIVNMHQYLDRTPVYWLWGVVLKLGSSVVRVRADSQDSRIYIIVSNPDPSSRRTALSVIRATFRHILAMVKESKYQEFLPLPDNPQDRVLLSQLHACQALRPTEIMPPETPRLYNVRELLDLVEQPVQGRSWPEPAGRAVIKTVVELDLKDYTEKVKRLEADWDMPVVAWFNDQIQPFVDVGLAAVADAVIEAGIFETHLPQSSQG